MLGNSLASSPLATLGLAKCFHHSAGEFATYTNVLPLGLNSSHHGLTGGVGTSRNKWIVVCSTTQVETSSEDPKTWEECKEALSCFDFSVEEKDKILGKAFGHIHSPYWTEERAKESPKVETLNQILEFLRSLGLSDEDLHKVVKKFPEVLGCSLEEEMKPNIGILENQWGITGKSLRNLLLRNPKVLGFNVDCKGDCAAQCTRCWVRF
uniref:Transcription termination factor 3, mitochondrial n=1 Tax=Noccaea caerulescens TaxID=107243 RepID=A0A1J3GJ64_NOCCA